MNVISAGARRLFLTLLESESRYLRRPAARICADGTALLFLIAASAVIAWVTP